MLVKLQEAQAISTTVRDPTGRTVAEAKIICKDLLINPEHVISIGEDSETTRNSGQNFSRIETLRGSFIVRGTPFEVQNSLFESEKPKSVLKG